MIKQLFNIVDPDKIALKIKVIKEFKFVPLQSVRLVYLYQSKTTWVVLILLNRAKIHPTLYFIQISFYRALNYN